MRLSLRDQPIRKRLSIVLIAIAVIPVLIISAVNYITSKMTLQQEILENLRLVVEGKEAEIIQLLNNIKNPSPKLSPKETLNTINDILSGSYASHLGALTSVSEDTTNDLEIILVDENGYVLASLTHDSNFIGTKLQIEPVEKCTSKSQEINKSWRNKDGKLVWGASMCIKQQEGIIWTLIVQKNIDKAVKPIVNSLLIIALVGVAVIALVTLLASYLAKTMSEPIIELQKGLKIVGSGDLEYRVRTNAKDEIGDLSREFDKMAENLKEMIDKYVKLIAKYKGLMNILPTGVEVIGEGTERAVREINTAILHMFGYSSKDEYLQLSADAVYHNAEEMETFAKLRDKGPVYQYEVTLKRKDGSIFWASINSTFYLTEDGKKEFIHVVEDITNRKQNEEKLKQLAFHDTLTGLPNRKLLYEITTNALCTAKRYNHQLAILFIDLDKFKQINDTLGHDCGDMLLIETSRRIRYCLRECDTLARLGGDEFVIVLPMIRQKEDAAFVSERIINEILKPFHIKNNECSIGTSIGIAIYPDNGRNIDDLMKNADNAMYKVKEQGKNNYKFCD
ncbi:PAS/PAC sensor-containing diguanylate cyclase/phosphodiesterase [Candidatus Magnetoovum chiemensis]|nr:PAS/PAC sensor-containing diguanylate cyclase/phosphodiesterase [Candidatus Magnetoovum chiemensis]